MMSIDEAVRYMRTNPQYAEVVRDAYLGTDSLKSAERFQSSAEFLEVLRFVGGRADGGKVLDLGAGIGIASWAFARSGARCVYALEPDPSDEIGRGAMRRLIENMPIELLDAYGEKIPLPDEEVDVVYTRQVLHHTNDLPQVLRECTRILKSGGVFLASREHVVDDDQQLREFLDSHPVHQLAGGENAYRLAEYTGAIRSAGLKLEEVFGPWDTIINAFPTVRTPEELKRYPRTLLERRFGRVGALASKAPGVDALIWRRLRRPYPGRLYSFLAIKP